MPSPGQSSCLLNQTSVTRGALSCRKMKRQAQAQVQETATLIKLRENFNNTTYTTPDWIQWIQAGVGEGSDLRKDKSSATFA